MMLIFTMAFILLALIIGEGSYFIVKLSKQNLDYKNAIVQHRDVLYKDMHYSNIQKHDEELYKILEAN